jgi:cytoskeleton protein RodZ
MTSLSTEQTLQRVDAFSSPGRLLQSAREARGMSRREVADALNIVPSYVRMLEEDDYQGLASPGFARGYIRNYGRLLDIAPEQLLPLYEEVAAAAPAAPKPRVETRPVQLQATGVGIVVGLAILVVVVAALWFWQSGETTEDAAEPRTTSAVVEPLSRVMTEYRP